MKLTIDKLEGCDDYPFWKRQITTHLRIKNLEHVIGIHSDGETKVPTKQDELAVESVLIASIGKAVGRKMVNCSTAKSIWED